MNIEYYKANEELLVNVHNESIIALICDQCNDTFARTAKGVRRNIRKNTTNVFCCHDCQTKFRLDRLKVTQVVCRQCNATFDKRNIAISQTSNDFCSRSCAAKYNNVIFKKRKAAIRYCKYCSKQLASSHKGKYCSYECKYHKKIAAGFKTKGSVHKWDIGSHARFITKDVENVCKRCGYKVHTDICHVKPVRSFPADATLNEINDKENLILLCPTCHYELDKLYKNDLLKFMSGTIYCPDFRSP